MTELRVSLPDDIAAWLAAEAEHRGMSSEAVAADVITRHAPTAPAKSGPRPRFVGSAHSGRHDLSERFEGILAADLDG